MRILEKVPKVSLRRGTGAAAEVFLLVALLLLCGEEPPGPVVGVLTAGLHVEVVQAPVLQLLAEVLNTNLQHGSQKMSLFLCLLILRQEGEVFHFCTILEWRQSSAVICQRSILCFPGSKNHRCD